MKYDMKKIGERIRECRKQYQKDNSRGDKSQEAFGFELKDDGESGFDRKTINKWETGKALPPLHILLKMCELFECELGYLLCEPEYENRTIAKTNIAKETGLSVSAISILQECKKQDDEQRKEWQFTIEHDEPLLPYIYKPIPFADVISSLIESCPELNEVINMFEEQIDELVQNIRRIHFDGKIDDIETCYYNATLNRSYVQREGYINFLITTTIGNILSDFFNNKIEEEKQLEEKAWKNNGFEE